MSYEINLIEGERGKLHVTSDDARTKNALMFGTGRKVFNMDHAFEATMPDSNTVRITSGVFYDNGMFIRIDRDRYVEVPVDNGLPGTYRHDLVCIRYERNIQTQLESASIVVKKGEASETKAVDPAYSEGDVLDLEVHLDEFPLYRVALDGITPKLEPLFTVEDVISNIALYEEIIGHIQDLDNPHQITSVDHATSADRLKNAVKINGVEFDGTKDVVFPKVEADSTLNSTSTNAVQNKVVKAALDGCAKIGGIGYDDVNKLVNEGMYIAFRCSNMPAGLEYCGVIVARAGTNLNDAKIRQIAFGDSSYEIYTRYTTDPADDHAWSAWKKMLTANDISRSTAVTTAGTYALDAVENNASVSGTLANRIKAVEDTVGKVYTMSQNNISGSGTWKTSKSLSLPAGTYVVTRKGASTKGYGMHCGIGYDTGSFSTSTGYDAAIYTEIITLPSTQSINMVYLAEADAIINLELKAVRIK